MRQFESFMAQLFNEYISYRSSLGFVPGNTRAALITFDHYIKQNADNLVLLTSPLFLKFRRSLKGDPCVINGNIFAIRRFFQFLVRKGTIEENPLKYFPKIMENAYIPFVFSENETQELLSAVQKRIRKTHWHFIIDLTRYMAIMLMARCGMRISEPCKLLLKNYNRREKSIYIEKTKFHKDRLIPIPEIVSAEIENYLSVCSGIFPERESLYLLARKNRRFLNANRIYPLFRQAVKDIGLNEPKRIVARTAFGHPRPHSLRHSFAINTLKRIKERGKSPQNALPVLAAYLGHCDYRYTAVYLKVLDANQRNGLVNFALSAVRKI